MKENYFLNVLRKAIFLVLAIIMPAFIFNCAVEKVAADKAAGVATNVYTSTTSRGDLVNYTVNGSDITVDWSVTDATGVIQFTGHIPATCGAQNATYGYRTCTVGTVTCTAGAVACPAPGTPPTGAINVMEIPGTALVVHVPAAIATAAEGVVAPQDELHAGFVSGGCPADVSGTYAFIRASRANGTFAATDLFGLYQTDATFNSVTHAEFGMTFGATASLVDSLTSYTSNPGNLSGVDTLVGNTCQNGVYARTVGGTTLRINATAAGSFIIDMPAGQGGMISFKTSNAAAITDIANKSWWGILFPDFNAPEPISMTSGAVGATVSNAVDLTGTTSSNVAISAKVMPASDASLATKFAAPTAYTNNNALKNTYAAPANIPGLMQIDDQFGNKNVVALVSKSGTQVMMYGVIYDYRTTAGASCVPTGIADPACIARNSGNFIVFSH